jgi:hypothetical protein
MKLSLNENCIKTNDYVLGGFWNLSSSLKLDNSNNNNNKLFEESRLVVFRKKENCTTLV